jgi:hypothetical protein
MHTIVPRDRERANVLAAVKAEALKRRPDGRPGRPLRAVAVQTFGRGEGMVHVLIEQRNDGKIANCWQGQCFHLSS